MSKSRQLCFLAVAIAVGGMGSVWQSRIAAADTGSPAPVNIETPLSLDNLPKVPSAPRLEQSKGRTMLAQEGSLQSRSDTVYAGNPSQIYAGNPTNAPFKWAGLWSTRTPDGYITCTAQFITPRVILLAAHCIRDQDTGQYYDPWNADSHFLLQWQNEQWTEMYSPLCKATWSGWAGATLGAGETWQKMTQARRAEYLRARAKTWQWDYAFVYLNAPSRTGYFNYRINEPWSFEESIGYPGKLMGGAVIQYVQGDVFRADILWRMRNFANVQVMWHGNYAYTQGSSGGAWVANPHYLEGPDKNIIVGLNSMIDSSHPGSSFGPVLNNNFINLLRFVGSGCRPRR